MRANETEEKKCDGIVFFHGLKTLNECKCASVADTMKTTEWTPKEGFGESGVMVEFEKTRTRNIHLWFYTKFAN